MSVLTSKKTKTKMKAKTKMPKYIIPIDAWVEIEADDAEQAWRQAITYLGNTISEALEEYGESGVTFGEPEEDE